MNIKTKAEFNFSYFLAKWPSILAVVSLVAIAVHFAFGNWPLLFVIVIGGIPLLIQIFLKLIKLDLGADLLAAIALITAIWLEEYVAANLLILMLSSGQALEEYATKKASYALNALANRMPSIAHRKKGDKISEIDISEIQVGDFIIVYPHEICPVDGTVVEGHGSMDESYLTGEPYNVSKAPGVTVLSGAINGASVLTIRADKLPKDSRYAKIMEVMEEAENNRPNIRRLGDQIGAIFAPISLIFALAVWYFTGDSTRFLAVLVVATPCPLLIAIPITIISAISISARLGIIIRDPTVLERLPTCKTAIFDKTGTLTYGQPELLEIITVGKFEKNEVLQFAASLERYSKHPLALSVLRAADNAKVSLLNAEEVSEKPGQGLFGKINGKEILVTHRKKLIKTHPEQAALLPESKPGMECLVLINDKLAATFQFRDAPRAEGHSFVTHLAPAHSFEKVMLVSGDRIEEVKYLADLLGIKDIHASQTPEQKLAIIRAEAAKAPTLFMGDGINDAPALAAATVGLAFGQHSSVTSEAAGAVIMDNTLAKVDELIHISESMRKIALQSALGGMLLSVVGMGFAAAGYISPVAGALLQEAIDVLAILNALRLTWQPKVVADIMVAEK